MPQPRKNEARSDVLRFLRRDGQDEGSSSAIVGVRVNPTNEAAVLVPGATASKTSAKCGVAGV